MVHTKLLKLRWRDELRFIGQGKPLDIAALQPSRVSVGANRFERDLTNRFTNQAKIS